MWEELHQIFKKRILEKTLEEWKIIVIIFLRRNNNFIKKV